VPEYLAPGVYVEEVSGTKSIEGVSTSTTGFVGPTRRGPLSPGPTDPQGVTPEVLTNFLDFQRIFGGLENVSFGGTPRLNYMAHAVRAYFDNGGSRLYVARVAGGTPVSAQSADLMANVRIVARTPGAVGNGTATITIRAQPSSAAALNRAPIGTLARTGSRATPVVFTYYLRGADGNWHDNANAAMPAAGTIDPLGVEVVTATIVTKDGDDLTRSFDDVGFDPAHPRYIGSVMSTTPSRRSDALEQLYGITLPTPRPSAFDLFNALANATNPVHIGSGTGSTAGTDGTAPTANDYRNALALLAAVEDISIVAAPGSSFDDNIRQGVHNELIAHCERRRAYRIAVLDTRRISTINDAREDRAPLDSTYAALYTPWVVVPNPLYTTGDESQPREIVIPPSGAVCGIYARTDVLRGVYKAPANEVVRGALRHDLDINFAQQEVLNPIGVNCLRFFPNRGNRVWGARTISSDPEWKYVNVRRYFNYLEHSIDVSTQWAVFEPNGERLWANIRETVSDYLVNEWRSGALLGSSPKEAFFVRCDRSTMDQNDLENGRLICLIGVAVVKPAEFVIFRVGQKTADARN
jgi:Bacteriophage tail sheath protein